VNEQGRNLIIGVFFIAAICISVWMILFLHPTVGDQDQVIKVRFSNLEKIKLGTRVTYAGRPMGQVTAIERLTPTLAQKLDPEGNFYIWQLDLAIDSGLKIHSTDDIQPRSTGLFGERDIAILPKQPPKGVKPELITTQVIYAQGDPMDNALAKVGTLADRMGCAVDKICEVLTENKTVFHDTLVALKNAATSFNKIMEEADEQDMVTSVTEAFDNMGLFMISIKKDIDKLSKGEFFENLAETSSNMKNVTGDIKDGKGTVGRMLKDEDLYLRLQSVMGKGETLMNNVNNYGFLFHANRNWKRENQHYKLSSDCMCSPTALRDYFDCEIDKIQNTLSSVQTTIDETRCECPASALANNPCFVQEFQYLLMQVSQLQAELQAYTEQLAKAGCR
jgi:phospholipid/cholesterol/gamma-HCH transport system substrate-binding protein